MAVSSRAVEVRKLVEIVPQRGQRSKRSTWKNGGGTQRHAPAGADFTPAGFAVAPAERSDYNPARAPNLGGIPKQQKPIYCLQTAAYRSVSDASGIDRTSS
jgi:hypothetical protein